MRARVEREEADVAKANADQLVAEHKEKEAAKKAEDRYDAYCTAPTSPNAKDAKKVKEAKELEDARDPAKASAAAARLERYNDGKSVGKAPAFLKPLAHKVKAALRRESHSGEQEKERCPMPFPTRAGSLPGLETPVHQHRP